MQHSDFKNYKTLLKETKALNKWRDSTWYWIIRLNIVRMETLPKLIYKFDAILIKNPTGFFAGMGKLILKFIWKLKGPRIDKTTMKKNKFGAVILCSFKTYFKTMWYWHKDKHIH